MAIQGPPFAQSVILSAKRKAGWARRSRKKCAALRSMKRQTTPATAKARAIHNVIQESRIRYQGSVSRYEFVLIPDLAVISLSAAGKDALGRVGLAAINVDAFRIDDGDRLIELERCQIAGGGAGLRYI